MHRRKTARGLLILLSTTAHIAYGTALYAEPAVFFNPDLDAGRNRFSTVVNSTVSGTDTVELFTLNLATATASNNLYAVQGSGNTTVYVRLSANGAVLNQNSFRSSDGIYSTSVSIGTSGAAAWNEAVDEGFKVEFFSDASASTPVSMNALGIEVNDWGTCCFASTGPDGTSSAATSVYAVFDPDSNPSGSDSRINHIGSITNGSERGTFAGTLANGSPSNYNNHFVAAINDTNTFNTISIVPNGSGEAFGYGGILYFSQVAIGSVPPGSSEVVIGAKTDIVDPSSSQADLGDSLNYAFDGGELLVDTDSSADFELKSGGGTMTTQDTDVTFSGEFTGTGGLTKAGEGTLTLTGANDYTGGTVVSEGILSTAGGGTLADGGALTIAEGAGFVAGTADTVGAVDNAGTLDVDAALTVASLDNSGTVTVDAALTSEAGIINQADGEIAMAADITAAGEVAHDGTLTVTGERTLTTAGLTGTGDVTLDGTLTVAQSGDTGFGGAITGTGGLTKAGEGTLILTGANDYTGGTVVSEGILSTAGGGTLADEGALTIAEGAGFVAGTADTVGAVDNAGTLDVDAALTVASLDNSGTVTVDAALTSEAGIINQADGEIAMAADITAAGEVAHDGTLTVTGERTLTTAGLTGTGDVTLDGTLTVAQSGDTGFGGAITGTGGLTKAGEGTLTLTGANDYTGGTVVSEGILSTAGGGTLADDGALTIAEGAGFVAGTADTVGAVDNAGTLDVDAALTVASLDNSGTVTVDAALTSEAGIINQADGEIAMAADITAAGEVAHDGTLTVTGERTLTTAGLTGTGDVTLDGTLTVAQSGDTGFGGAITGTGGLTKAGEGTLILTGANDYTGGTVVSEGILSTAGGGTLADDGALTIAEGAGFVAGTADTVGAVDNAGTLDVDAALTVASLDNSGTVTVDAALTSDAGIINQADGEIAMAADITAAGEVAHDGTLTVTGERTLTTAGLTGTGDVTLDGTLTVAQSGDTGFGGAITGTGGLTKAGEGTLILTGANDYTGGTVVSEGILSTAGGGTLADGGALTIAEGAGFVAGTADTVGAVDNAGTLDVDAALTVASLDNSGTVTVDAALTSEAGIINQADGEIAMAADITAAGEVAHDGTLTVTGERTLTTAGLTGTGDVTLDGTLTVAQSGDTGFGGAITGTGGLTKAGEGTLILTGANGYTGGTVVSEGILSTAGGGTLADGGALTIAEGAGFVAGTADTVGAVDNAGTLDVDAALTVASLDNSGTVTVDAALTSEAGIINQADGEIAMAADITAAGEVAHDGTLTVTGERTLTTAGLTGTGDVTLDGTLTVAQSGDTGFGGAITGTGGLTKAGEGTLILTGANDYTGGTVVSEGILSTAGGGTLADGGALTIAEGAGFVAGTADTVGAVDNAGTLDVDAALTVASLDNSGTVTVDAALTSDAGIINQADGEIAMAADIAAGTFYAAFGTTTVLADAKLSADNFGGTGAFDIDGGAALTLDIAQDALFEGTFEGDGDLVKAGGNTLVLTGDHSVGSTRVADGALQILGTVAGERMDVDAGARLFGSGAIAGGLYVDGILAAGDGIGTMTVAGNVTFGGSGLFEVDIDGRSFDAAGGAGSYDRLVVTGSGSVVQAGGTIAPFLRGIPAPATNAFVPVVGDVFRVIETVDNASGISGRFDTLVSMPDGIANGTRFSVVYGENYIDLAIIPDDFGLFASAYDYENMVEAGRAFERIYDPQVSASEFLNGLNGLASDQLALAILQASGEIHAFSLASVRQSSRSMGRAALSKISDLPEGERLWTDVAGFTADYDADETASTYGSDSYHAWIGLDLVQTANERAGAAIGYSGGSVDAEFSGDADYEGVNAAVYYRRDMGALRFASIAGVSFVDVETDRSVGLSTGETANTSDSDMHVAFVEARLSYEQALGAGLAGTAWGNLRRDVTRAEGFTEEGSDLTAVSAGQETTVATVVSAGYSLSGAMAFAGTDSLWNVGIGATHSPDGDRFMSRDLAMHDTGWTVASPEADDLTGFVEAGVRVPLGAASRLSLSVQAAGGDSFEAYGASFNFSTRW